jgi:predicted P-loop ATPase
VHAYREGEHWWPHRTFEAEHIAPQQEARYEHDAWEQPIAKWLDDQDRVTIYEVAFQALKFDMSRIGTADQRRIGAILERRGWRRGRDWRGRFYTRP